MLRYRKDENAMEFLKTLKESLILFLITDGIRFLLATIVLFVLWKFTNWFFKFLKKRNPLQNLEPTVRDFFANFFRILVKILLLVTYIAFVGVPVSSIVAAIASCGVAIGLALQGGLSNFAGGVILVFMKPFKEGDFITAGGESGTVMNIGVFYTLLRTLDNRHVYIPNASLTGGCIVNASAEETRRLDLTYSVAYGTDTEKVKNTLLAIADKEERILRDPAPAVILSDFSDSSIDFSYRVWCASADYWPLRGDLQERVKAAFEKEGIEIPFPQVDVHMK